MLFVIGINFTHRLHARVSCTAVRLFIPLAARLLLVPVVNAPHKRRNQLHTGMCARRRLAKGKQQRQIGVDAALLQLAGGLNAFPRGSDFDQHPIHMHALPLIQFNQTLGTRDGGHGVKAQAGIHLCRDATGNMLENLAAKTHQQMVHGVVQITRAHLGHGLRQQRCIFGLLHRLQNQRWIGGGILRLVLRQLMKVACIGHHGGVLLEVFELVHKKGLSSRLQPRLIKMP